MSTMLLDRMSTVLLALEGTGFAWLMTTLGAAVVFFLFAPLRDAVDGFFAVERPVEVFFCAICYLNKLYALSRNQTTMLMTPTNQQ